MNSKPTIRDVARAAGLSTKTVSRVPWAMLSAGMPFPAFLDAVVTSCEEGGACGFIAGRVYWKEAVALDGEARRQFLATTGRERLEQSVEAMSGRARPWYEAGTGR